MDALTRRPLRTRLAAGLFVALLAAQAAAQEASPTPTPASYEGVWKAELPGGEYLVKLSAIRSVSHHEYVVDNVGKVTEVNIDTDGSALARFYCLEPLTPQAPGGAGQSVVNFAQDRAQSAASRAGAADLDRRVIKSYPVTTHAHTIEYRLESKDLLLKLFKSAETSWLDGRGATFRP